MYSLSGTLRFPFFFFFNDTATTEIYTLSLHDALPICPQRPPLSGDVRAKQPGADRRDPGGRYPGRERLEREHREPRSEEHTSELQSQSNLVCRLLLEKKKTKIKQRKRSSTPEVSTMF